MSFTVCGYCSACGAPMFMPQAWYGIYPPTASPSCRCTKGPQGQQRAYQEPFQPTSTPPRAWEDRFVNTPYAHETTFSNLPWNAPEQKPQETVQEKIETTRKIVERLRQKQVAQEAKRLKEVNDLSGIESLGEALEGLDLDSGDERIEDVEKRMDRLEAMMVTTAQHMQEIKKILTEKVGAEVPSKVEGNE